MPLRSRSGRLHWLDTRMGWDERAGMGWDGFLHGRNKV